MRGVRGGLVRGVRGGLVSQGPRGGVYQLLGVLEAPRGLSGTPGWGIQSSGVRGALKYLHHKHHLHF